MAINIKTMHPLSPQSAQAPLTDLFSRTISYLRLSLTDRCNLRCLYCVTEDERNGCLTRLDHGDLLSYEELLRVVAIAVGMGISKVRLTGGEPLVRRDVMGFIRRLTVIPGLDDVRLTTNGVLLEHFARELFQAGLRKLNVSLDTLRPERFARITGSDQLARVWRGIEAACGLGFNPVKLNMVVMRGINDDELPDFARLAMQEGLVVRFIEFMPIGESSLWTRDNYMGADEIKERLAPLGRLVPEPTGKADGPARLYRLESDQGTGLLGFISPISHEFCDRCNRLRLTSEGRLRSCLLHDEEIDLKEVLRRDGTDDEVRAALLTAIRNKPEGHKIALRLKERGGDCHGRMSRIGG